MLKKKASAKKNKLKKATKEIKKLSNNITKLLDKAKIKYRLLEHKVVYTAHDVSATTKKKLGEIAKVVLIKADKNFVLIVLPAGKYIDFKGIQKALKAKKVSIASEKDIVKYLKTKVGLLHPFGSVFAQPPHPTLSPTGAKGLLVLLDKTLAKSKKIISSAGSYTHSIELAMKDFEKLISPIKGIFSKNKR